MAPARRVAVIGGGIGGLSAAIALRRRGIDAQVYEAAPKLNDRMMMKVGTLNF